MPWNDTVRQSGVVRVFVGEGMRGGHWGVIVDKAISALNSELANNGVQVEIKRVNKEADAEAILETRRGNELHAQSFLEPDDAGLLRKVTIKMPATPRVSQLDKNAREVGAGVRLYMLAHELVHTLGLTNAAHSKDDVFTKSPGLLQKGVVIGGKMLADDAIRSYDLTAVMPPIKLGAATLTNLKKAWP